MDELNPRSEVPLDDEFEGTIFSAGPLFPVAGAADDIGHYLDRKSVV